MKHNERQIEKRVCSPPGRGLRAVFRSVWCRCGKRCRTESPEAIARWRGSIRVCAALLLLGAGLVACIRPSRIPAGTPTVVVTPAAVALVATPTPVAPTPTITPAASPTASLPATVVRPAPTSTPGTTAAAPTPTIPKAAAKSPTVAPAIPVTWATHADDEKSFKYPAGWKGENILSGIQYRLELDGDVTQASIYARQAYRLGTAYYPSTGVERKSTMAVDYLNQLLDAWLTSQTYTVYDPRQTDTINGNPAIIQRYTQIHGGRDVQRLGNTKGIAAVIQKGDYAYFVNMFTRDQWQATFEPVFQEALRSFSPKRG